ncbi:hypothetical protein DM02DRAFT_621820 [Periconia macrospinosa]|uniref:Uncharacterized protein n=1 Tax=Periconia macrospinosa TaxID=97972 RepID=A0A2V1EEA0_9PLEO|nr:hypothetical protein DM02DRAFT_621820 [Periconia macrospinosa]
MLSSLLGQRAPTGCHFGRAHARAGILACDDESSSQRRSIISRTSTSYPGTLSRNLGEIFASHTLVHGRAPRRLQPRCGLPMLPERSARDDILKASYTANKTWAGMMPQLEHISTREKARQPFVSAWHACPGGLYIEAFGCDGTLFREILLHDDRDLVSSCLVPPAFKADSSMDYAAPSGETRMTNGKRENMERDGKEKYPIGTGRIRFR